MYYSNGTWEGLPKKMVQDGSLSIEEMIGTRDDLFLHLVNLGIDKKSAYMIMDRIRRPKALSEEDEKILRDHGAEEWILELCRNTRWLQPRSHIVQLLTNDACYLFGSDEINNAAYFGHCVTPFGFWG